jgi:hypothetical protein
METSGDWNVWGGEQKMYITRKEIFKVYTEEEVLDMIDTETIENYIRKKKLEKITKQ